ncbi:MAG: PQQ-dependent sugar dehydrogenase [SAR324 cluster bacterium]|nr:PQQ-dependent sugar dehydrogenase [SAR324 cluster bacterium]
MLIRHFAAGLMGLATSMMIPLFSVNPAWADDFAERIELPPGFAIAKFAHVPNARSLVVLPSSRVIVVGSRTQGTVSAIIDRDGDFAVDDVVVLERYLNSPNGVAYHEGYLYVAEQHQIRRAQFDEKNPISKLQWEVIHDGMTDNRHHGSRDLAFSPGGRLFVALGSPCNVCRPTAPNDSILSMNPDGSDVIVHASGIRNSVGMAFNPVTGELYFTDNGVDMMGDDSPPDELNHAPRAGLHFGFPWYGGGRDRTNIGKISEPPRAVTFPVVEFQAHTASLGLHFYRGSMFPAAYRNDLFVAQHGSWNRSTPTGYRITRVRFDDRGLPAGKEIFAQGWLQNRTVIGRPVDVAELSDGSLLVSDDATGWIYRITYDGG